MLEVAPFRTRAQDATGTGEVLSEYGGAQEKLETSAAPTAVLGGWDTSGSAGQLSH